MTQILKTVASFRDLPLAGLAKSKLDSEGIPCFLANKNLIGINWLYSFALGGIKLQVRESDVENAKKILNHDHSSELEELEDQFPELGKDDLCTKCGSSNLSVVNTTRKAGALSLLLHLPLIIFRKRYRCLDCGNIMKK